MPVAVLRALSAHPPATNHRAPSSYLFGVAATFNWLALPAAVSHQPDETQNNEAGKPNHCQ